MVSIFATSCARPIKDPVWYPPSGIKYTDGYEAVKAAADKGDPDAMYALAVYSFSGQVSPEEKKRYLIMAAERKHRWAQIDLNRYYRSGIFSFSKDYREAIYWAQRATCDYPIGAPHAYLAELYSDMDHSTGYGDEEWHALIKKNRTNYLEMLKRDYGRVNPYPPVSAEERALVTRNLPLAYAHMRMDPLARHFSDNLEELMTEEEIEESDRILELFSNGGCPYGD